jgi:hypothetical protein
VMVGGSATGLAVAGPPLDRGVRNPPPSRLISLTCSEVQHLFAALLARPAGDLGHRLRWSLWRRRYQARARTQANGPMKFMIYG